MSLKTFNNLLLYQNDNYNYFYLQVYINRLIVEL